MTIESSNFPSGLLLVASQGVVRNNTVSGSGMIVNGGAGVNIVQNYFDSQRLPGPGTSWAWRILLQNGSGNRLAANTIDGGWDGIVRALDFVGAEDGIMLIDEKGVVIEGNNIRNTYGAAIELRRTVPNSFIRDNNISNTQIGFGGWWDVSLTGNVFSNNTVTHARALMQFFYVQSNPSSGSCLFSDNKFLENRLTDLINEGTHLATGFLFPDSCTVERNTLQDNDYGGADLWTRPDSGFKR